MHALLKHVPNIVGQTTLLFNTSIKQCHRQHLTHKGCITLKDWGVVSLLKLALGKDLLYVRPAEKVWQVKNELSYHSELYVLLTVLKNAKAVFIVYAMNWNVSEPHLIPTKCASGLEWTWDQMNVSVVSIITWLNGFMFLIMLASNWTLLSTVYSKFSLHFT